MLEFKCPLCKQIVSKELFEKITGIWKERRAAEKRLQEQEKELMRQKKDVQRQLITEKKRLKTEQKSAIDLKIAEKTKQYDIKLQKVEAEGNKLKERFNQRIVSAVKSAEVKARRVINQELKNKMQDSVKKEVEKATVKSQKSLFKATQTIEATKKQMSTLQVQNLKQQDRIKNLETQLQNQTTPQLEGLLFEDKLTESLQKDFPQDKITHTGKGGDILHEIIFEKEISGIIIYECKKVNAWQGKHAEQAYNAKIQRKADYAILVTNANKKGASGFFIEKDIIVVDPGGVLAIASILRDQIVRMAQLRLTQAQKDEAIEKTLHYLQGAEFKNALEVVIRKTIEMYDDLKKECLDHVKIWRKRHDALKSVYINTAQVQTKTTALISGKADIIKEAIDIQPFPALPDLTEI